MSGIDKEVYKLTDLIPDFFNPVLYREKMVLDKCKKQLVSRNDKVSHLLDDKVAHLLELFMSSFPEDIPSNWKRRSYFPEDIPNYTGHHIYSIFLRILEGILITFDHIDTIFQRIFQGIAAYFPNDAQEGIPNYIVYHAQDITIHCVTELREAGIEFKKSDHHGLLDIEFKEGKLHIPTLFIDDNTVPVLLNFIALEQRHHWIKPYFTSYLMFLDYLVDSSKDVEHLHYKGIINHGLGSDEEVATLFNKLCKEVVQDLGGHNYLSKVFKDVNKYFGKRRNRWRAAWKHEYFRTPWAFTSFLAAIVLIVLTFLQSYFAVYAYFYPPPK